MKDWRGLGPLPPLLATPLIAGALKIVRSSDGVPGPREGEI